MKSARPIIWFCTVCIKRGTNEDLVDCDRAAHLLCLQWSQLVERNVYEQDFLDEKA